MFYSLFVGDAIVRVQEPVRLNDFSESEPDISLLRKLENFYEEEHPNSKDVILLVEVSDTTLDFDRTAKMFLYAESAILEFWIINLSTNQVEVYQNPVKGKYKESNFYSLNEVLVCSAFPNDKISVKDIFGKK